LVNCSGGNHRVSDAPANNGKTVNGMGVVVCDVAKTSGPITRNRSNCKGDLSAVWLHSGQKYSSFRVSANQRAGSRRAYPFYNAARGAGISAYAACVTNGRNIDPRHSASGDGDYCEGDVATSSSSYLQTTKAQFDCLAALASR
jgi:hypothetical protein